MRGAGTPDRTWTGWAAAPDEHAHPAGGAGHTCPLGHTGHVRHVRHIRHIVFVRLKLSLLRNGLRQSGGRRAAYVASAALVLLFTALQLIGLIALRGYAHVDSLVVLLAAVLALGWAVMPLFFPGGDETLDPTRLVMLPLRPGPLVRALLVSSLVGIGPLFTLCVFAGSVVAVAHGGAAYAVGVVGAVLALLVCVTLARAVAAANVRLLTSRKGRDLAVLSGLVVAVGAQLVNFGAQRLGSSGLGELDPVADVVRWVPPASAVDAMDAASHGSYGTALAQLALTAAALVLLLRVWAGHLTRLMTCPTAPPSGATPARRANAARPDSPGGSRRAVPAPPWSAPCAMCGATRRPRRRG